MAGELVQARELAALWLIMLQLRPPTGAGASAWSRPGCQRDNTPPDSTRSTMYTNVHLVHLKLLGETLLPNLGGSNIEEAVVRQSFCLYRKYLCEHESLRQSYNRGGSRADDLW